MTELEKGTEYISKNDKVMRELIKKYGPCELHPSHNYFKDLVSTVISQQLSYKVFMTIQKRLFDKLEHKIEDDRILVLPDEDFRACGLSQSKTKYIKNVAVFHKENPKFFKNISKLTDAEIMEGLTSIKGIGEWSAQMFLIFNLNRLDVFPMNDLGIKNAIKKLYNLKPDATEKQIMKVVKVWGNYSTVASLYLWKSLDNK